MKIRKTKKSVLLGALLACSTLTPAWSQILLAEDVGAGLPRVLIDDAPLDVDGDDLGNHTATEPLNMSNQPIKGVRMEATPALTDGVNVDWVLNRIQEIPKAPEAVGDNLGDHIATTILRMGGNKITNVGNAYLGNPSDAVNIYTLNRYLDNFTSPGDNLGNHIAVQDVFLDGNSIRMGDLVDGTPQGGVIIGKTKISGLEVPSDPSDAVNKEYVDSMISGIDMSGVVYTTGNQVVGGIKTFSEQIIANGGIDARARKITNLADATNPLDGVNLRTLTAAVAAGGDNLGNHTATQNIIMGGRKITGLALPTAGADAANKAYVDGLVSSAYVAGSGLTLTGNTFAVDASVVRTSGAQTISGAKTFEGSVAVSRPSIAPNLIVARTGNNHNATMAFAFANDGTNSIYVGQSDQGYFGIGAGADTRYSQQGAFRVNATTGDVLWKGVARGSLNANGTIIANAADPVAPTDVVNLRSMQAAITNGGDNLGNHTATQILNMGGSRIINVAGPINGGDAVNKSYVDSVVSGLYTAGSGLTLTGNTFAVDGSVVRIGNAQTITGQKTFTQPLLVENTFNIDGTAPFEQRDGLYVAALGETAGTTLNPTFSAAIMGQVNANRSVGFSMDSSGYMYGFRSHTADQVYTWQSKVREADVATSLMNPYLAGDGLSLSGTTFAVDSSVVRTSGDQNIAGNKFFSGEVRSTGNSYRLQSGTDSTFFRYDGSNFYLLLSDTTNGSWNSLRPFTVAKATGNVSIGTELSMNNRKITAVAWPTVGGDAANKAYVDGQISSVPSYTAGGGISIPANNVISVDNTVVRTFGNQSIAGLKTFSGSIRIDGGSPSADLVINRTNSTYNANMTFMTTGAGDVTVGQGDNAWFNIGNNNDIRYAAAGVFGVNAANGNVQWKGVATGALDGANNRLIRIADPISATDGVNLRTLQSAISGTSYTAGSGLTLSGSTFAVDGTVVRTNNAQTITGQKTFTRPLLVDNTFNVNGSGPGQQQDGLYVATLNDTAGTTQSPLFTAAIMGQVSAARSIGVSVDGGGYLYGFRTHVSAGTYRWESKVREADVATSLANPYTAGDGLSLSGTTFAVNGSVVRTSGNQSIAGVKTFSGSVRINGTSAVPDLFVSRTNSAANANMRFVTTGAGDTTIGQGDNGWFNVGSGDDIRYGSTGTFAVHTVNGNVRWKGVATGSLDAANDRLIRVADPTSGTDAVNLRSLNSAYTGGSGINVNSSQVITVDGTVVRTTGTQTIPGAKTFSNGVSIDSWNGISMKADAFDTTISPSSIRANADTSYGIYAGSTGANNERIRLYLEKDGVTNIGGSTYKSPILFLGIPHTPAITGNSLSGTGVDPADNGNGVVFAMSYRDVRFFRTVGVTGGLSVFPGKATDIARFDVPITAYQGMTVNPGSEEVRFNSRIYAHQFTTFSDERLKKDFEDITPDAGMKIVRQFDPMNYTYKEDDRKSSGVIAQDIQKIMPWAVSEAKDGMLSVDYTQMIAPITASIQQLDARTTRLEERMDALEAAQ